MRLFSKTQPLLEGFNGIPVDAGIAAPCELKTLGMPWTGSVLRESHVVVMNYQKRAPTMKWGPQRSLTYSVCNAAIVDIK